VDWREALKRLKAGNERFVEGKSVQPHRALPSQRRWTGESRPLAAILGCSDSLVSPELIFDQGFGDLFVIRVAGNVVARSVLGSMQFAGAHLGIQLFIVLGHEGCGAVKAALDEHQGRAGQPGRIEVLLRLMRPALRDLDPTQDGPRALQAAVEANVRWSVQHILAMPGVRKAVDEDRIQVMGAVCETNSGLVSFLPFCS
jgi:carbonic anhydrase